MKADVATELFYMETLWWNTACPCLALTQYIGHEFNKPPVFIEHTALVSV